MKTIDVQGLKCPMPLIETKKALKEMDAEESLKIIIDNETSVKNVTHYLEDKGFPANTNKHDNIWEITVQRGDEEIEHTKPEAYCKPSGKDESYVVLFAKDRIGEGAQDLGSALVDGLLNTVNARDVLPQKIIFINSGINLVIKGSPVLPRLKDLAEKGVDLITCGACLDYYEKMDELEVSRVSNMHEILETMLDTGKVISF